MKKCLLLSAFYLIALLIPSRHLVAQQQFGHNELFHTVDLGFGLGLDYGGLVGIKAAYILPFRQVSVFGAAGVQLVGLSWNVGTTFRILPMNKSRTFRPNIKIMYGINCSTYVNGIDEYKDMYTGWTPGIGAELRFGRMKSSGFDVDINIPIGSDAFNAQVDRMKNDPRLDYVISLPIAFSIGYHREF